MNVPGGVTYLYGVRSNGMSTAAATAEIEARTDPAFDASLPTEIFVDEHTARNTNIGDPYTATDPDGDSLRHYLSGPDEPSFTVTRSRGQLTTKTRFDYETKATYYVTVSVRDGSPYDPPDDDTINVTITVTDADDDGEVTITDMSGERTASLTDQDGTPTGVMWQWARASTASGTFSDIIGETSASYTPSTADSGQYLQATASYTDAKFGSGKTASGVTSDQVGGTNSAPTFPQAMVTRGVDENSPAGTTVGNPVATDADMDPLVYSLSGVDAAAFEIDSDGQIKTVSGVTYDFEATQNTYTVTLSVHDNKDLFGNTDTTIDASVIVNINLRNVDEPGMATIYEFVPGTRRVTFAESVTDPEGVASLRGNLWYRGDTADPEGVWTTITDVNGNPSEVAEYMTVAADVGKYIKVRVRYTDDLAPNKVKSAEAVTDSPLPASNSDPAFDEGSSTTRTVPENSLGGVNVGAVLTATDRDGDSADLLAQRT